MAKTYTQEEVNDLLSERIKTDLFERIIKFRDDVYNMGFADGYKKGV